MSCLWLLCDKSDIQVKQTDFWHFLGLDAVMTVPHSLLYQCFKNESNHIAQRLFETKDMMSLCLFFVFPLWWLIQHDRASMSRSVIVCLRQISLNRAQRKGNHGVPVILIQSFHRWSWWKLWKKRKVQLWTFSHIPWPHSCPSSEKPDSRSDVQNQRNLLLVILRDGDG